MSNPNSPTPAELETKTENFVESEPLDSGEEVAFRLDLEGAGRAVVIAKRIGERAAEMVAASRAEYSKHLAAQYAKTKSKTFDVELDGEIVASATIPASTDETKVASDKLFLDWVREVHGEEHIETVERVRPTFQTAFLKKVEWVEFDPTEVTVVDPDAANDPWADATARFPESHATDGEIHMRAADPKSGQMVPGLVLVKGRVKIDTFGVKFHAPKAAAAKTDRNRRTGRDMVDEFMKGQSYEEFVEMLVSSGVLQLES